MVLLHNRKILVREARPEGEGLFSYLLEFGFPSRVAVHMPP